LVNEDDFPLVNNIGDWPNGCLIAPFFGRLGPDKIYSSDALTVSASSKQTTETSLACSSDAAAGGSSETGTPVILIFFYQNVRGLRTKCNDFSDSVLANIFKIYYITETWLIDSV
jgi:hypothetical protein